MRAWPGKARSKLTNRPEHLHRTRACAVGSSAPKSTRLYCICPTPTAIVCLRLPQTQVALLVVASPSAKNRVAVVAAFRSKSHHTRSRLPPRARTGHHASDLLDEHSLGPLNSQSLAVSRYSSAPFWQQRAATQERSEERPQGAVKRSPMAVQPLHEQTCRTLCRDREPDGTVAT